VSKKKTRAADGQRGCWGRGHGKLFKMSGAGEEKREKKGGNRKMKVEVLQGGRKGEKPAAKVLTPCVA